MLITYCSNDVSKLYGDKVFAVEAGLLPYEDKTGLEDRYTHIVEMDVDEMTIFGCPSALVIDASGETPVVREKNAQEALADQKPAKLEALQLEKVRVRDGGIIVDGVLFDTDKSAMDAYTRTAVFVFQADPTAVIPQWKASEGVWVEMTYPLLQKLIPAGLYNESAAFAWQKQQEALVMAATTQEELDAVSTTYGQ